jgi:hypothetical protein
MERNLTCSLCKSPIVMKPITFIEGTRQYTVDVPVCINESCLERRGARFVDTRTLSRPNTNAY